MREYFGGKVAAVTGGASGIGLALCEALLRYGARTVVLADVNAANLDRHVARLAAAHPGKVHGIRTDVTREAEVTSMVRGAAGRGGGRLDLLVNNAGAGFFGAFDQLTDEDWKRAFDLNFHSAIHGVRAALPIMRAQGGGQILNVASGIAYVAMPYQSMYSATKAAVLGLTTSLRYELWDEGIRLSTVVPGTTRTAIWGDGPVPEWAISAEESAEGILKGAMNNDRVIFVTQQDIEGAKSAGDPELAEGLDRYGSELARKRRSGEAVL